MGREYRRGLQMLNGNHGQDLRSFNKCRVEIFSGRQGHPLMSSAGGPCKI